MLMLVCSWLQGRKVTLAGVLDLDMSFRILWRVYVDRVGGIVMCLRRWTITGTLDPVRNLTGLTFLNLLSNRIGGMCIFVAVGRGCVGCVGVWMPVGYNITATHMVVLCGLLWE